MSSDEALQKNNVTTETENSETASSPETGQPPSDNPSDGSAPEAQEKQAESQPSAPSGEQPATEIASESQATASVDSTPPATEESAAPSSSPPASPEPVNTVSESQPATPPTADTSEPVTTTPMAETPPSEPVSATPTPDTPQPESPATVEPPQASDVEARPRPQLNPTVDPNAAKPVPTLDTPSGTVPPAVTSVSSETTEPSSQESEPESPPPSAEVVPKSLPAEVPKAADLDADLEAQIAAAQASDEASGSQPVPSTQPPAAEGTEADPAKAQETPAPPTSEEELEPGHRMPGKVQSVSGDDVFFDVGFRSPALVSIRQFDPEKQPEVGQTFQIVVDKVNAAEGLIYANLPRGKRKIQGNWDAVAVGQVVDCMVTKTNKGGLEITVSSLRGFLPASQVDLYYVPDLEKYVGEKLTVKITEANRGKRNLIVSRRQYLQDEREAQSQEIWKDLEVGQSRKGVVKTIKDYGAFVDIGGVDGFLHIGEISWSRIRHPSDVLSEGQDIDVQILSLDEDRKRIGLGMRQLSQNPWDSATQKYAPGTNVSGRVTRTTDFGAFVELEPGVEGLVHISELDYRRVNKVTEMLNVGDETELKVLDVDLGRKRISLSLKALKEKPPELDKKPEKKSDEDMAPSAGEAYNRKRKGPLKGGTGGSGGGGLFGNPGDFS